MQNEVILTKDYMGKCNFNGYNGQKGAFCDRYRGHCTLRISLEALFRCSPLKEVVKKLDEPLVGGRNLKVV